MESARRVRASIHKIGHSKIVGHKFYNAYARENCLCSYENGLYGSFWWVVVCVRKRTSSKTSIFHTQSLTKETIWKRRIPWVMIYIFCLNQKKIEIHIIKYKNVPYSNYLYFGPSYRELWSLLVTMCLRMCLVKIKIHIFLSMMNFSNVWSAYEAEIMKMPVSLSVRVLFTLDRVNFVWEWKRNLKRNI